MEVIKRGIEGLTQITGIGPKKAEAIFEFSQNYISQTAEAVPATEETSSGEDDTDTAFEATEQEVETDEAIAESEEVEETVEEDQEFPVSELPEIDPAIVQILESNGFQTIAELSVTLAEELVVLEGIDEELANSLVEQARLHMENFENV
jgi:ERCC4-type nuclease